LPRGAAGWYKTARGTRQRVPANRLFLAHLALLEIPMRLRRLCWSLFALLALPVTIVPAQDTAPDSAAQTRERLLKELNEGFQQYESQMQAVLRTRFPQEKDFVAQVVLMVQRDELPRNLVDSAWLWVRKNRPSTKYPFVYFERVLRLRAEKLKLAVPPFDREQWLEASRGLPTEGLIRR
jgi:hypothetical protein